jgi:phosphate transport system protein
MSLITKDSHNQHISQQFNADLSELKDRFLLMGGMVEKQVSDAVTALIDANGSLAEEVRLRDNDVDELEVILDEECTQVIARRQPAASDLRMVMSIAKMVSDLERIGDEASKVAKMANNLADEGTAPRGYVEVRHIGEKVLEMVREALDAFARYDSELALVVMRKDVSVDQEYKMATRSLVTFMMEDPRSISRVLSVMWVLRALERIGDHACNVAEHVIYMVNGKDVRHVPLEQAEKVIESKGK